MDWDRQKALSELGIPGELYDDLVRGFIRQSEGVIADLAKAFQDKDFEKISRAAHFIKGASGNLRIDGIYVNTKELEASAKSGQDLGAIEQRIQELVDLMETLKKNI
jgi:HPt (histidine-containing phosphotransfer) domain-containing protein